MPLRDLEYQARVLTRFDEYLTELAAQKAKVDALRKKRGKELKKEDPSFRLPKSPLSPDKAPSMSGSLINSALDYSLRRPVVTT